MTDFTALKSAGTRRWRAAKLLRAPVFHAVAARLVAPVA